MKKMNTSQILVMAATLLTLLVNILANALPLNGQTTGEVSDQFDVYFVPAGYVFAIWGIIYLGLLAYAWYQARADQADNSRLKQISRLYVGSAVANMAWLFLWHYQLFALTLVAMITLLVLLILIFQKLQTGKVRCTGSRKMDSGYTLRDLPGMDLCGDHSQCHRRFSLLSLEWFRNRSDDLGHDHVNGRSPAGCDHQYHVARTW